ncbi:unnamed protein product [Acidocella sp. C78]|nr:unnamed protein product [Acidocella sp. C78]
MRDGAPAVVHGDIGGAEPDIGAALASAAEFAAAEAAGAQVLPEFAIVGAVTLGRGDEQAVMAAGELGEAVAGEIEEAFVGIEDRAVGSKADEAECI